MAYLCTSRAGWLAAADCFRMTKSLAMKATERIWNVRSNRAMEIRGFYGLWEFRRPKCQDEGLSVKHLSIPPNRNSPNITDLLIHHILLDFLCRHIEQIRCGDDASRIVEGVVRNDSDVNMGHST
ncbi:UNVERIFIED_CONTAM: hypothetical protein NCL1_40625 [Trichonephila clavipes]